MLKIAFCDDENQETRRLEALLEEYAADRGQDFAHTSYQSPVELMAEVEKSRVPIKQYLQKFPQWGRFGVTSVTPFLLLPVHPEGYTPAHHT